LRLLAGTAAAAAGVAAGVAATATASPTHSDFDASCGVEYETGQKFTNWSSTHSCAPARVYEPRSAQEVVRVLAMHHASKQKVRPVGQALSPNGIGMNGSGHLLSLAAIDYVEVDKQKRLVTVGAGATVSAILKELKKHGLTLQNFSSIQEQQIGGWTQVAAHGTGVTLPTVEEMIVSMNVATATEGLMTLSATSNPDLFQFAKVGLGPTVPCLRPPRLILVARAFLARVFRPLLSAGGAGLPGRGDGGHAAVRAVPAPAGDHGGAGPTPRGHQGALFDP
jgi:L-galactono-1,4-lactone dehydrogenase